MVQPDNAQNRAKAETDESGSAAKAVNPNIRRASTARPPSLSEAKTQPILAGFRASAAYLEMGLAPVPVSFDNKKI